MPLISPVIKRITEDHIDNAIYMRNSEMEANVDLDQVDLLGKTIILYYNLPTVDNVAGTISNYVHRKWPVEILIAKLSELDDNGDDGDTLRAECLAIADHIYDLLSKDAIVSLVNSIEDYKVVFEGSVKIYDKTMTGCRLTCEVPIERSTYYCD